MNHSKNFIDYTGQKIGKLTVIKCLGKKSNSPYYSWLCRCECGEECEKTSHILREKHLNPLCCDMCNKWYTGFIGKKYNMLTIIGVSDCKKYNKFICKCDCGNTVEVRKEQVIHGYVPSCGCTHYKHGEEHFAYKHGLAKSRIYSIYCGIKKRCYNPNSKYYKHYGERGIKICDEWLGENGFLNFYNWSLQHNYSDELSIDRIDVNGDYEPNNCRWATILEQANNKRDTIYYEMNGQRKTLRQWCEEYGADIKLVGLRLRRNVGLYDALTIPKQDNKTRKKLPRSGEDNKRNQKNT